MPKITYELGGQTFPSKTTLIEWLKTILSECHESGRAMTEEEKAVLSDLAHKHPEFEAKAAGRFRSVIVMRDPKYGSPCFGILRTDGAMIDFSYKNCL